MDRVKQQKPSRVLCSSVDARFHEFCTSSHRHVGHIATGSTCHAPTNSAEQQWDAPQSYCPVVLMSNETSNHNAAPSQTDEATIISHFASPSSPSRKPRIVLLLPLFCLKRDTCIALVHHDTWDRMTGHAPRPLLGKITSFLLLPPYRFTGHARHSRLRI